jgi:hypothetical protein
MRETEFISEHRIYLNLFRELMLLIIHITTERVLRLVGNPASYSGGPGFKSRAGDRLS